MAENFYKGTSVIWRDNAKKYQGILFWYDEDGKRHQKTKLFTNKKRESQERYEEWKNELNRKARLTNPVELVQEPNRKTVGERLREYLKYLEHEVANGNYEQSTLTAKWDCANLYIFPLPIADIAYTKLSKNEILEWEESLRKRGIANSTIGNPYSLLRRVYNYDIEHEKIEDTPFRFLKSPKASVREKAFATDDSIRRLVDALDARWKRERGDVHAMCYFLALYTGMRGQEICGLRWRDIYLPQNKIVIRNVIARNGNKPYQKMPKTKNSERVIPIMSDLRPRLEEWRKKVCWMEDVKEPEPNWFVVGDKDKFRKPQWVTQNFGRFCRRNNVKASDGTYLTMHGLRHTFATVAVQSKAIDIKTLAAILGDTVSMVMNTYAGVGDDDLKYRSMEEIGRAFKGRIEADD
ncbi:tyrosine-type recombinase/integrase [Thermophilibacter provencensis]|uniref:tyrosine-type recombinase/integrase n=1 Tax=Thermophilibacter provencensis TaxID=1852386 RepID=UPI0023541A6F|nr:site-specific integrase [Thermophilibacter provencensis]